MKQLTQNNNHIQGTKVFSRQSILAELKMKQLALMVNIGVPYFASTRTLNIFLNQNKGKGPPGVWHCPETDYDHLPDYKRTACNTPENKDQNLHKKNLQIHFTFKI